MLTVILTASALVAATVVVHAVGLALLLRSVRALPATRLSSVIFRLIGMTTCLLAISMVEIAIWGVCYLWQGSMPTAEAAFYFSGATYTTLGYGDLVLAAPWRMLGPIEGLTGILMCGLSAGFFFAVISRMFAARLEAGRR